MRGIRNKEAQLPESLVSVATIYHQTSSCRKDTHR